MRQFFFRHFVTPHHLPFLATVSVDEFLLKPVMACAFAAMANRSNDQAGWEGSRHFYVDAITATNAAIRHPRRVRDDETLIAVCLLSCYEVSSIKLVFLTDERLLRSRSEYRGISTPRIIRGSIISKARRRCFGCEDLIRFGRGLEQCCLENFAITS